MRSIVLFVGWMLCLSLGMMAQYPVADPSVPHHPFHHGVASGDALSDRVILWTRVTSETSGPIAVQWVVSTTPDLASIVAQGEFVTDASRDYTVKVDAQGLSADTWYYYGFTTSEGSSQVGRTKTIPEAMASVTDFRFALASCANYEGGYFNAYRSIAERNDLQAVFHVGDYTYEYGADIYGNSIEGRTHLPTHETVTLGDYRARQSNYKRDIDLQAAHRQYPWYMSWDDHETVNNAWAGGAENHDEATEGNWSDRLQAALQAYYEWNPVRDIPLAGPGVPAYRTIEVGDLAKFYFLETRLNGRSEQVELPNVGQLYSNPAAYLANPANLQGIYVANAAAASPARTMLGADQKTWLETELAASDADWNVLVNQTVMAGLPIVDLNAPQAGLGGASLAQFFASQTGGLDLGDFVALSYDNWDGYQADRAWLYSTLAELEVPNPLVLTGDIHSAWANTLVSDFATGATIGAEFVTTQIAGDVRSFGVSDDSVKTLIPYVEHFRQMVNGYTVIELSPNQAQADYYNIRSTAGAPVAWNNLSGTTGIEDREQWTTEYDLGMVSYSDAYRDAIAPLLGLDTIPRNVGAAQAPLAAVENPAALAADGTTGGDDSFTMVLLHNNDGESSLGNIDHFAAVLSTERSAAAAAGHPSVFVSSGDNMLAGAILSLWLDSLVQPTGTPYDAIALSMLDYDALCIGNHEFDFGPDVLAAFIDAFEVTEPPFLTCNLSFENVPSMQALVDAGRVLPSTVVVRDGQQIGIVGAITPELIGITSPGATTINPDIVGAIQAEVSALTAAGVNKIILISHLQSITNDIELATSLSGIDIIVAGGGDNYLTNDAGYAGPHPVFGPYPYVVTDAAGEPLRIVTTVGNYTHLGALTVTFDAEGNITDTHPEVSGIRQVDLGPTAPSDAAVYAAVVQPVQEELAELAANGATCLTQIDLDVRKPSVRSRSNGIGNIVADAYLKAGRDLALADPIIPMPVLGIANGGGIRCNGYGSSQGCIYPAGYTLSEVDMNDILPFANFISVVPSVSSEQLKLIFENSVSKITLNPLTGVISGDDGRFAQISGGTLVYDVTAAPYVNNPADCSMQFAGLRVQSLVLDNGLVIIENGVPVPGVSIPVATVDFTAGLGGPEGFGGDCYPWGTESYIASTVRAADAFINYLTLDLAGTVSDVAYQAYPPVTTGRIQVLLPAACADETACNFGATAACLFADVCGVCGGNGSTCAPGCTDATACNYDANAVTDDGSCVYGSASTPCVVSFQVAYSEDDAEESLNPTSAFFGTPYIDSSDLELTQDGLDNQAVGIRFREVTVPAGATIASAYLQFTVDALHSGPTSVNIALEDAAVPAAYSQSVPFGISSRPTYGSVAWSSIPAWTVVGEAGANQATPDLSELIQYGVNRPDWAAGQPMAFVLTGSGRREAEAFDGMPAGAPVLHIEYYFEEEPQPCVLGVVYVSEAHTSGEPKDYIELYNSGSADCWLTGFQLDDATVLQDLTFGEVLIEAGGYWIGYEDAPGSFTSGLSSGGDLVVLGDGQGNSLTVVLGPSIGTLSQSFSEAGVGCYTTPTPGTANAACPVPGCTDATACNFNPAATANDGTCEYPTATVDCNGNCINDADGDGICDENEVENPVLPCVLGVVYVSEAHTSGEPKDYIELYNSGTADCMLTGFQLDDAAVLQDLTFGEVLIEAGGYWIGYEDAPGSFTSGLSSGGDLVVLGDGQGNSLTVVLGPSIGTLSQSFSEAGVGCYTTPTPGLTNAACGTSGCTDVTACNFDATATIADNSCTYSDGIIDCAGSCVNDSDADGVCDENEGLAGCTDPFAENYNPQASDDDGSCWASDITFEVAGTHATGQFDAGAAEIVDYHAGTQRLFYVNASARTVDCLNMSSPAALPLLFTIDATAYGASANSLVVFGDYVAVAIEGNGVDAAGQVVIFDVNGNFVSAAPAGFLPDAVTVSHDEMTLVVSNEGQPSEDYTIDPVGSVTLVDVTNPAAPVATQVGFTGITSDMLDASVRIFGPGASIAQDLEPEYSAFSADDSQVYVSCQENNCVIVVDVATATVTDMWGLGLKDHMASGNGLDASNQDGAINIQNWPVKGFYLPDAIHSYEANGTTYLVMANEGDTRAYSGYSEEGRVASLQLDPTVFPTAATLKLNANLGRLLVTKSKGDIDGDGDYDELYSVGGRSFSIYTTDGTQVYDSGDDFEQIIATLFPADFNSTNSGNASFDNRSDDKGPEPEGVEIGEINGRMYAFIGLERMSGVMVYDITDPLAPVYQRYLSNRDFSVANSALQLNAGAAGDLGPEGLVFVHATDSPDGQPYLVTSNEISGTVTAYALTSSVIPPVTPTCQLGVVYVSEAHTSGVPKDYIELYNSGSADCSLEGFKLDDSATLTDLTFGDVEIAAGGYWIGYEDAAGSFTSGLSSGGDIVVFGDPSGATLMVTLGASVAHYGQSFDAEGDGCYAEPTPGAVNASCEATQVVTTDDLGCTYPTACNYDAEALFDNGSCDFTSCVGCTYEGACNYDAAATIDDGTCDFMEGDFDGNGFITMLDLLDFLAVFGTACE